MRQCARQQLTPLRSSTAAIQKRNKADSAYEATHVSPGYSSPFRGVSNRKDTTSIPSFKAYRSKGGENSAKVFQYFMVGTMGAVSAIGAKNTVQGMSKKPPMGLC